MPYKSGTGAAASPGPLSQVLATGVDADLLAHLHGLQTLPPGRLRRGSRDVLHPLQALAPAQGRFLPGPTWAARWPAVTG